MSSVKSSTASPTGKSVTLAQVIGISLAVSVLSSGALYFVQQQALAQSEAQIRLDMPDMLASTLKGLEREQIDQQKDALLAAWPAAEQDVPEGRYIYGSLTADVSLVEFSDFECPFCKRFHDTPKALVEQSNGHVNWEWQHFPLSFNNPATEKASHAAECVGELEGNKAFWAFSSAWFENSGMGGKGVADIAALAASVGADRAAFNSCMESGRYKARIKEQLDKGVALGVTGTPGTFVIDNATGNRVFVRGAQSGQALVQAIKQVREMGSASKEEEDS